MSLAIQSLMDEHRLIEDVLSSLEAFASQGLAGSADARTILGDYVRFFREFADRCHHGKEEDRLFVKMAEHGFSQQWGPLKVMLQEHTVGRGLVRQLGELATGDGPLSENERARLLKSATEYVGLLRAHIQKEDTILYPAALRAVPESVMEGLAEEFERFEDEVMGQGAHEGLHALAERLVAAHTPV